MEEMKEMERQIKMAWERGHEYGLVKGIAITYFFFLLAIWAVN